MKFYCLFLMTVLQFTGCHLFSPSNDDVNNNRPSRRDPETSELAFSPDDLPEASVGKPYSVKIKVFNQRTPVGGVSISPESLPEGLTFKQTNGAEGKEVAEISGTPQKSGKFKFVISVWCYGTNVSGQSGQKEYELVVK